MQSRATITSKKMTDSYLFPVDRSLFYKLMLDDHAEARRVYERAFKA